MLLVKLYQIFYVIHSMILLVELVVQEVLYHYVSLSYYLLNQNKIRQWGN